MCPAAVAEEVEVVNVQATIIHQIVKKARQTTNTPPKIRVKLQSDTTQVIKLIEFLDDLLSKHGLAHSYSSTFANTNTLSKVLNDYLFSDAEVPAEPDELDEVLQAESPLQTRYRRITNHLTHALHHHISKDLMTTGDHLPLIFYSENGIDYLYLALLSLTDSITINEDTGDILDTTLIDAKSLKVACKINLTAMQNHAESIDDPDFEPINYVAWIQRGKVKIVEYIQNYLPIMFRIDDKSATTKLMRTVHDYLASSPFENSKRAEISCEIIGLLRRRAATKQPINIVEDIDTIFESKAQLLEIDLSQNTFKSYRDTHGYSATDDNSFNIFTPATDPLNNFEKFDITLGNEKSLKISGNQRDLGHKIDLLEDDPNNPRLVITLTQEERAFVKQVIENSKPYESTPE